MIYCKNLSHTLCSTIVVLATLSVYTAPFYLFDLVREKLALNNQIIMDSALYTDETGDTIALLTHTQTDSTAILLATINNNGITLHSTTYLHSLAFKLQWLIVPDNPPYIVTDEYDRIALYKVDFSNYELTLIAWTPNLAAGKPSTFLHCFELHNELYVIQGLNKPAVATYNVILEPPLLTAGIITPLNNRFNTINACSIHSHCLLLEGISNEDQRSLVRYTVNSNGHLRMLTKKVL